MNRFQYRQVVSKALECGSVKYDLNKTQKVLIENFGSNLTPPKDYDGLTILEAYMQGYNK